MAIGNPSLMLSRVTLRIVTKFPKNLISIFINSIFFEDKITSWLSKFVISIMCSLGSSLALKKEY